MGPKKESKLRGQGERREEVASGQRPAPTQRQALQIVSGVVCHHANGKVNSPVDDPSDRYVTFLCIAQCSGPLEIGWRLNAHKHAARGFSLSC